MIQRGEKCSCQVEGTPEYDDRIDNELHIEAGLVYAGKDSDGEKEWVGTKKQWNNLEKNE